MYAKTKSLDEKRKKTDKNKGLFVEVFAVAPAPSRDYYALQLFQKHFVWTRWKISHGPYEHPIQRVISMDEFLRDVTMQNELTYIFGAETTDLTECVGKEKWSLVTMPSNVIQTICSYLSVPDILRLSQVCKRFSKECSNNELWQIICKKQWKILIHNDIEKAGLIGWKQVYLEKMRPRRYKTDQKNYSKPNYLQRTRVPSISTLNITDSHTSISKSSYNIHKRIRELKDVDAIRSSSEVFGKDFKDLSISTGKSTDRTFISNKGKTYSRTSELGGKLPATPKTHTERKYLQQSSHSVINLLSMSENLKGSDRVRKNKSPRTAKSTVTSIRTRSTTSQPIQPTDNHSKLKISLTRPTTGKSTKLK